MSEKITTPILTAMCFSDVHNCFSMLEPPYHFRKTATRAIDHLLETKGQVDVVLVGGDLTTDYPHWDRSGWWPYEYYLGYKDLTVKTFAPLAKEGKVTYIAGNHDFGNAELSKDGPGIGGSYNPFDYYFTGPMKDTLGELPESEMFWVKCQHNGEKYLLAYHYVVNGVHLVGLSPDPDKVWNNQVYGFNDECLEWLDKKLKEIDPNNDEVILMSCHFHLARRVHGKLSPRGQADEDLVPILKSHRNLFYLYGHVHTRFQDYSVNCTSEIVVHYDKDGVAIDSDITEESYGNFEGRGFSTVYMGNFRTDYDKELFEDDVIEGYGGFDHKVIIKTTGTPKVAQGTYITVYEDRVEFQSMNFGTYEGYTIDDTVKPYTVYRTK